MIAPSNSRRKSRRSELSWIGEPQRGVAQLAGFDLQRPIGIDIVTGPCAKRSVALILKSMTASLSSPPQPRPFSGAVARPEPSQAAPTWIDSWVSHDPQHVINWLRAGNDGNRCLGLGCEHRCPLVRCALFAPTCLSAPCWSRLTVSISARISAILRLGVPLRRSPNFFPTAIFARSV
jgi:hypothetical protein